MDFLPICKEDMEKRGWECCDFVYVIGDAYVDHPSFGHAIISRVLENAGYTVGIISQPDWKNKNSIDVFGRPRLGFLVSGGNMDSMVNHYSVTKHRRKTDAFTPGGVMGKRPDYATIVYCNLIRQTYKDVPILIGGIEASLRRLAHYDYWSESIKRSILLDSQADLLMYGMGEKSIVEIADALNSGLDVKDITYIDGTVYKTTGPDDSLPSITLPAYEKLKENQEAISSQALLSPIAHRLSADGAAILLENQALLEELGFEIEEFGENTVLIRQIPMDLDGSLAADSLETLAADLLNGRKERKDSVRDELLHTVAC